MNEQQQLDVHIRETALRYASALQHPGTATSVAGWPADGLIADAAKIEAYLRRGQEQAES